MKDVTITDNIIYIGADDKDLDLFESQYVIPNGVSYNSYVILDEKTAVMDTVDARRKDEWLENLEKALAGRTVDYLVVSGSRGQCEDSCREISGHEGSGQCQNLSDDSAVL